MTDQPRGAYTPQQDVPLQFDPRSPASRRPLPMALIASGALLVVLVAAVGMYYSRGVRGDNEPPRPVGEPVAVLKAAPSAEAQPADPAGGLDVAAPQNVPGKAPVFAAAPEQPKPRQAPATKLTVQTLSASEMGRTPSPPVAAAKVATAAPPVTAAAAKATPVKTIAAAPVLAPAPETPDAPIATARTAAVKPATATATAPKVAVAATAATTAAPAKAVAAAPAKVAAATPTKTSAVSATGVRVQIGAFSSSALADKGYSDVAAVLSGSMSGKGKHVEPVAKDGQTLYRTSVTGFSDRAAAAAFCDALKAKGKICFVKS